MLRSSSSGNWHMMYKSYCPAQYGLRMWRYRRVPVNIPKYSPKTGINWWTSGAMRVPRPCNLVTDRRYGWYSCISLGQKVQPRIVKVRCWV